MTQTQFANVYLGQNSSSIKKGQLLNINCEMDFDFSEGIGGTPIMLKMPQTH